MSRKSNAVFNLNCNFHLNSQPCILLFFLQGPYGSEVGEKVRNWLYKGI